MFFSHEMRLVQRGGRAMNKAEDRAGQRAKYWTNMGRAAVVAGLMAGCACSYSAAAHAQMSHGPPTPSPSLSSGTDSLTPEPPPGSMEGMMAARSRMLRNVDRQKHLVTDTDRLVDLANELKLEVANSGSETLTPEMQRKIAEIEKLARSVKDKMRD
jgi:hypothetical protein